MKLVLTSLRAFCFFTVMTGLIYPVLTTKLSKLFFPGQAEGSLIYNSDRQPVGSTLIGQNFTGAGYFWSRPSATSPTAYNAQSSSGSNLGPTNPALLERVQSDLARFNTTEHIPVELVTTSGSGLDPHISLGAAIFQVPRVAAHRRIPIARLQQLISDLREEPVVGMFGPVRINVLKLNLALAKLSQK